MSDTYTRSVISFSLKMGHFTSLKRYLNISYISQIQFLSNILNTRKECKNKFIIIRNMKIENDSNA